MAENDIKRLYQGQLPSTVAALYTAPNGASTDRAMIKDIAVVNTSASAQTINFFTTGSTDADMVKILELQQDESATFNGVMVLNNGEAFYGVATSASAVTVTVHGMELT